MLNSLRILGISALLCLPVAAANAADMPSGGNLICSGPITGQDTAQTLMDRFKGKAAITDLPGAEGEAAKGVVIYPDDPARRLEVFFFDDDMKQISMISPAEGATAWTVQGLKIGMPLKDVVAANGSAFRIYGFDWDYGGYATDLGGGKLSDAGENCSVGLRFNPADGTEVPQNLSGEVELSTDDPALLKLNPYLSWVSLQWAAPNDQ